MQGTIEKFFNVSYHIKCILTKLIKSGLSYPLAILPLLSCTNIVYYLQGAGLTNMT